MNIRSVTRKLYLFLAISIAGSACGLMAIAGEPQLPEPIAQNDSGDDAMADKTKRSTNRVIEYKNRQIEIPKPAAKSAKGPQSITIGIDGAEVEVTVEDGVFSSILLPHGSYKTPEALARDVIDYVPSFKR